MKKAIILFVAFATIVMGQAQKSSFRYAKQGNDFRSTRLMVSGNKHFLQYEDGTPFFYLGDTAWELFHKLNREEVKKYLENRAQKGFNVIQAVALSELDGISVSNAYGYLPFIDNDPLRPAIVDGSDNDYWDHVDYIVKTANDLGMFIGFLPTWGRYWRDGDVPIFNAENAAFYGEFLGKRYKDAQVIWILGGDRNPSTDQQKEVIRAMARGLEKGDGGVHLKTFHPTGWSGSADFFNEEKWLDFNMRQNGHETECTSYLMTLKDYSRTSVKPVLDGEPIYEDHPVAFNPAKFGHSIAMDTRRALYWDLFNGAFGHTYGHHSIWQMYDPAKPQKINNPLMPWYEAIHQKGSEQMQYARRLMESRPFFTRIPATDQILVRSDIPTEMPGEGRYRFAATCDENGTYAFIYAPVGRDFKVRMNVIKGNKVKAWWYNPRNGKATSIGVFTNEGEQVFTTPNPGEMIDWILVLDDASQKYKKPGTF